MAQGVAVREGRFALCHLIKTKVPRNNHLGVAQSLAIASRIAFNSSLPSRPDLAYRHHGDSTARWHRRIAR